MARPSLCRLGCAELEATKCFHREMKPNPKRRRQDLQQPEQTAWEWNRGPIGRLMKMAYFALRKELEGMTRRAGMTTTQWSALGVLYHFPGLTNADLEHFLHIERPSVTSLINGMAAKGWVERKDHPKDARSKCLFLTPAGVALARETRHFAEVIEQKVFGGFTHGEIATLRALLEKIVRSSNQVLFAKDQNGTGRE